MSLVEMIVAGAFALVGLFSLRKWLRVDFEAASGGERIIYAIHVTARVGLWFAFAGFFFGYALVDRPTDLRWYIFVPIGLAAVQLLSGIYLARTPAAQARGNVGAMSSKEHLPGRLEPEKEGATSDPGHPQPQAAEVESARILANEARSALRKAGLTDDEIRRLADQWVAEDRGESLHAFIDWAGPRRGKVT